MWFVWGPSTSLRTLGAVADQCPRCNQLTLCTVSGLFRGLHVFFISLAENVQSIECVCSACGGRFRGELWHYNDFVPVEDAVDMSIDELLALTNPALKKRLEWAERQEELSAIDSRFAPALDAVEQLRSGEMRTALMDKLQHWDVLAETERDALVRKASESARALQFIRSLTERMPHSAGCLSAFMASAVVWSTLLWEPQTRDLLWGGIIIFVGFAVGAGVLQLLTSGRIRHWTRDVLILEAESSGIDFDRLAAVLEDMPPPNPHADDELHVWRENAAAVLAELNSCGKRSME
jgi:hypothetical protein